MGQNRIRGIKIDSVIGLRVILRFQFVGISCHCNAESYFIQ